MLTLTLSVCCSRCSQPIHNIHIFRGLPYGPDCIEVVTGQRAERWVTRRENGQVVLDEEATRQRDEKRAAELAEEERRSGIVRTLKEANQWLRDVLFESGVRWVEAAQPWYVWESGFCKSMHDALCNTRLCDLSEKQLAALRKIYLKANKSPEATAFFDAKVEESRSLPSLR